MSNQNMLNASDNGIQIRDAATGEWKGVTLEKGQLLTYDDSFGEYSVVGPGTDGHILTADDAEGTGLKFAAATNGVLSSSGSENIGFSIESNTLTIHGFDGSELS